MGLTIHIGAQLHGELRGVCYPLVIFNCPEVVDSKNSCEEPSEDAKCVRVERRLVLSAEVAVAALLRSSAA